MDPAIDSVTIHSTWRTLLSSLIGAGLLFAGGLYGTIASGGHWFPIVLLALGAIFLLIVLVDFPLASRFSVDGVERRMVLRRHFIPWSRVRQLTRTRPGVSMAERRLNPGGLSVLIGKRRYLLADRSESPDEFDALEELLEDAVGDDIGWELLMRPNDGTPPTWLYRRSRWAPDGAKRR